MSPSPDPPFEPQPQGISLDELAEAFAQVMGGEPRPTAESATAENIEPPGNAAAIEAAKPGGESEAGHQSEMGRGQTASDAASATADDSCPISPRTILEAMLFVGNRENRPLSPARAADLMRDVEPDEIPSIVDELNKRYTAVGAPYRIIGEGDGYQLTLRPEFHPLRNRFYGRIREARLSQAAVDVLALVAYQQPATGEQINHLRGKPSSHILTHLVRRGLLRIERPDPKKRTPHYHTTDRFLQLFNLQSLADLPRSEDAGPP